MIYFICFVVGFLAGGFIVAYDYGTNDDLDNYEYRDEGNKR